jgi:hypothetical protein
MVALRAARPPADAVMAVRDAAIAAALLYRYLDVGALPLRQSLRSGTWLVQARACAALQADPAAPVEDRATVRALRLTAERALTAHAEAEALEKELRALVKAIAPVPGAAYHRHDPPALPRDDQDRYQAADRWGQERARGPPVSHARRRPTAVPAA